MAIPRRVRGVLGMAATWGVAFSALSTTALLGAMALDVAPDVFGAREVVLVAVRGLISGGMAGTIFALVLTRAERRTTLATLSARRVALWGFLGAAALPLVTVSALGVAGIVPVAAMAAGVLGSGLVGAAIGASMVGLSRRAPALPAALPAGGSRDATALAP